MYGKTLDIYAQSEKSLFSFVECILFSDFLHTDLPVQIVQKSSADKLTEFMARMKITNTNFVPHFGCRYTLYIIEIKDTPYIRRQTGKGIYNECKNSTFRAINISNSFWRKSFNFSKTLQQRCLPARPKPGKIVVRRCAGRCPPRCPLPRTGNA